MTKSEIEKSQILLKGHLNLNFNYEEELKVIDEVYTYEEASEKALFLAREKISKKLDKNEKIIYEKKLKTEQKNSTILLTVFFKVYENITSYEKIVENVEQKGQ